MGNFNSNVLAQKIAKKGKRLDFQTLLLRGTEFIKEAQVSSSNIKVRLRQIKCMENMKRSIVQSSQTATSVKMWKKELIKLSQGGSNSKKVKKKESSQEEKQTIRESQVTLRSKFKKVYSIFWRFLDGMGIVNVNTKKREEA